LLALRAKHRALSVGAYVAVAMTGDLVAYIRRTEGDSLLIALNLGGDPYALSLTSLQLTGRTILSTYLDRVDEARVGILSLRAHEGVIVQL